MHGSQKFCLAPGTILKYAGFLFGVSLLMFPYMTHAAVVINEIAWMGTTVSANDEWVELYNNGATSVSVDGWRLTDGLNLNIELVGSIASGQYAVLERTDDASAPGASFLIYAGALSNIGATLSLYRSNDSLEDRVVGGENWDGVGGDNVTKETAQHTNSGWLTANATPGASNSTVATFDGEADTEDEDEKEEIENVDTDTSSVSTLHLIPRTLQSSIDAPGRTYVNHETQMNAHSFGLADSIVQSLLHTWNFGDTTLGTGENVTHRFEYPGEYVVTLHSQYGDYEAYIRKTITVLPVSFSMTTNTSGDVQVHNDARYEIDISGYKVVAGGAVTFPPRTILLPNATITIPKERLQYAKNETAVLFDANSILAASVSPTIAPRPPVVAQALVQQAPALVAVAHDPISQQAALPENFSFVDESSEEQDDATVQEMPPSKIGTSQMAAPIEASETIPEGKLPYFALLAVIGLGVTAVFAGKVST